jgi:chaperonin GroES
MIIKPLPDNVVIKACEVAETTKSGIVLASASKEKSQIAEVVAVSEYGFLNGNEVKMQLKVGDKVIAAKFAGTEVKLDGVDYTILHLGDILAIVD